MYIIVDDQPYLVLEAHSLKMQQRRPVMQTKIRNLITGKTMDKNFQQSDSFQEADIQKKRVQFIYSSKGQYWFHNEGDPSKRFPLTEEVLGSSTKFLKPNTLVNAMLFNENIINIDLPIKMDFRVTQAPPGIKGSTAQGGIKPVTIETSASINVPLFINKGDIIRVNTQTEEYVERVEKA